VIEKLCHLQGTPFREKALIFRSGKELAKQASDLRPDVERYIDKIKAEQNDIWMLVHAIGAGEIYGANRNGDLTMEEALNHVPEQWTGDPELDKALASSWSYGWPTYYNAYVYANHCFPGDTEIRLASGSRKRIDDICVGDSVVTHTGSLQEVSHVFSRPYCGELITLSGPGIGTVSCTPEHPVLAITKDQLRCAGANRCTPVTHNNSYRCSHSGCSKAKRPLQYTPRWVEAQDIEKGDFLLFVAPQVRKRRVSNDFAWFLGLFLAEGSFTYKNGRLVGSTITIGTKEKALKSKLEEVCKRLDVSWAGPYEHKKNRTLMFSFKKNLSTTVARYVDGRYSHERRLTNLVFSWRKEAILHLMGGCIDGDGHQYSGKANHGVVRVRSASRGLLEDLKTLSLLAWVPASVSWDSPKSRLVGRYTTKPSGVLRIGKQYSEKLSKYSLKVEGHCVTKRCANAFSYDKYMMLPVTGIKREDYSGYVYNLEVSGDNSYTANGIAVHNCNKDPARKIGDVAFVSWDPLMKRVELIIRVQRDLAEKHGGDWALRRLDRGDPIDVSMGMRVPFDLSETETDWAKYNEALKTYNPSIHKTPGQAVLMYHRRDPIRGLAITRKDYTDTVKFHMGEVLPDGRKVCVRNTFPRFFDISLVIIGAERPAKLLWKMASHCEVSGTKCAGKCRGKQCGSQVIPSGALLYERLEKEAARKESVLKKKSDMEKETPSNFNPKAVAGVSDSEEELPRQILDAMGRRDYREALSTPSLMGIKLKPREFQRILLVVRGQSNLADKLDAENKVFGPTEEIMQAPCISHDHFSPAISSMLQKFMPQRSAFEPFIKVRMVKVKKLARPEPEQSTDGILQKISAAYNGYLEDLRDNFIKESSLVLHQNPDLRWELEKAAGEEVKIVVGDLAKAYLGFD
jgi:hypothetical protein